MYTVIIAEDEWLVRVGIKSTIPWEDYDMYVIADVDNGQTAWEQIEQHHPDIIITDILMPVMNGKELITRIRQNGLNPYIIAITCMEDFALAKDLLNLGVREYISKATITDEEIINSLIRAGKFLDKQNLQHRSTLLNTLPDSRQLCNQTLTDYFNGKIPAEEAQNFFAAQNTNLWDSSSIFALCPVEAIYNAQGNLLPSSSSIYHSLSELLLNRPSFPDLLNGCHSFFIDNQYFIIIFHTSVSSLNAFSPKRMKALQELHDELSDYLNIHFSFLLYPLESGLTALADTYKKAVADLDRHYLHPVNSVIPASDFSVLESEKTITRVCSVLEKHHTWIKNFLRHPAAEQYQKLLQSLAANVLKSEGTMLYAIMDISQHMSAFLEKQMDYEQTLYEKALLRIPYLYECISMLDSFLSSCEQYILSHSKIHYRREIEKALQLIENELSNPDLSLPVIASKIGLSENYFSKLFKQELNLSFIKYLSNARIEHAKKLLEQNEMKVYDIAFQCGFSDEAYFSRVFKKTTGISPSEWRLLCSL